MKILAPVKSPKEVNPVIKAGANEIYCGLITNEWKSRFSHAGTANSAPYSDSNFRNFSELKQTIEIAHSHDVPVHFTLNAYYYTKKQFPLLLDQFEKAVKYGIDAVIISDVGLLLSLKKLCNVDIHAGVIAGIFNNYTVDFFKEFGVKRIILPKQISIEEMKGITSSKRNVEFEMFVLTGLCPNVEAFCRFMHGIVEFNHPILSKLIFNFNKQYKIMNKMNSNILNRFISNTILKDRSACYLNYDVEVFYNNSAIINNEIKGNIKKAFSLNRIIHGCGACSIYELHRCGINHIKIEGRQKPTETKIKDVNFLNMVISNLRKKISQEELCNKAKDYYYKTYGYECNSLKCYYNYIK